MDKGIVGNKITGKEVEIVGIQLHGTISFSSTLGCITIDRQGGAAAENHGFAGADQLAADFNGGIRTVPPLLGRNRTLDHNIHIVAVVARPDDPVIKLKGDIGTKGDRVVIFGVENKVVAGTVILQIDSNRFVGINHNIVVDDEFNVGRHDFIKAAGNLDMVVFIAFGSFLQCSGKTAELRFAIPRNLGGVVRVNRQGCRIFFARNIVEDFKKAVQIGSLGNFRVGNDGILVVHHAHVQRRGKDIEQSIFRRHIAGPGGHISVQVGQHRCLIEGVRHGGYRDFFAVHRGGGAAEIHGHKVGGFQHRHFAIDYHGEVVILPAGNFRHHNGIGSGFRPGNRTDSFFQGRKGGGQCHIAVNREALFPGRFPGVSHKDRLVHTHKTFSCLLIVFGWFVWLLFQSKKLITHRRSLKFSRKKRQESPGPGVLPVWSLLSGTDFPIQTIHIS